MAKKSSWHHINDNDWLSNSTEEMRLWLLWCQEQGWLTYPAGFFARGRSLSELRDLLRLQRDARGIVERAISLGLAMRPGNYEPPLPHSYCADSEDGLHTWNIFGACNHCGRNATRAALRRQDKPLAEPTEEYLQDAPSTNSALRTPHSSLV